MSDASLRKPGLTELERKRLFVRKNSSTVKARPVSALIYPDFGPIIDRPGSNNGRIA
jgi:hypothetical protein